MRAISFTQRRRIGGWAVALMMLAVSSLSPASADCPLFPGQKFLVGDAPTSVSLGDLDGDGDLDMAVANFGSDDTSVLLNNGDGWFAVQTRYAVGSYPQSVALGDLDGDGNLDMAVANRGTDDTSVLLNRLDECQPPCLADLTGDGVADAGDLSVFITAYLAGDLLVDFTGDGLVDAGDLGVFITAYLEGC